MEAIVFIILQKKIKSYDNIVIVTTIGSLYF